MLGNKQNVFDDFVAAGEWLIASGITSRERLAISGGSNGGLLVGAALTQRPDLFQAVVCQVPLLDMLRYQNLRIARLWIAEYGSAEDADAVPLAVRLFAVPPRSRSGVAYPATFLLTAEGDSRVDPMHARKMAARLQPATSGSDARCCCGSRPPPATARANHAASNWRKPPTSGVSCMWQLGVEPPPPRV